MKEMKSLVPSEPSLGKWSETSDNQKQSSGKLSKGLDALS